MGDIRLGHIATGYGPVWFITSEETRNEIGRRVRRIIKAKGRDETCLTGLEYHCCLDDDQNPVLAREDTRAKRVIPTPWFDELLARAMERRLARGGQPGQCQSRSRFARRRVQRRFLEPEV
jgi:hypothetical protein